MSQAYKQYQAEKAHREFIHPTMHCPKTPDLWQVGIDFGEHSRYFLVRWRPPYNFTMVQMSDHPSPVCTEKDRAADEPRTLFPIRR